jgi:hypothetical protein
MGDVFSDDIPPLICGRGGPFGIVNIDYLQNATNMDYVSQPPALDRGAESQFNLLVGARNDCVSDTGTIQFLADSGFRCW